MTFNLASLGVLDFLAVNLICCQIQETGKFILPTLLTKFILTKTPKFVQIVFYSLKFNPFITTVMMHSSSFETTGMSRQDWQVFIISFVIGQIYWISMIVGGLFAITSL